MKKLLLLVCLPCLLLNACAPVLISANENTVIVQARRQDAAKAQDLAEAQCQKRGAHARMTTRPASDQLGFDCVR